MLYGHQRSQGPKGLWGQVTGKGTWQHYVGPWEASNPRGGQESGRLPLCLPDHYVHQPNGPQECSGNFLPHSIREDTSITPFCSITKGLPVEEQLASAAPPTLVPKWSPWPKRRCPSPDPMESTPLGRTTSKATPGGPSISKWQETLPWNRALKPSHAEAFSWDSDLVKETKKAFFSKHSYNFVNDGTHNLCEIFWQMATNAKLLGTSIHKVQASRMGPEELKQANYALRALPKGLKFLHAVPPFESPKVMGLMGIHDPDALCCFSGVA